MINNTVLHIWKLLPWIFLGRTDAEAETPILWSPDAKSWLTGKDPDARTDWEQEETGATEDEMVGWHHRLDGHGFGWTLGVGDGQRGLGCCNSWGRKESDMTERLDWTELNWTELKISHTATKKIMHAATKAWCGQINKCLKNDNKKKNKTYICNIRGLPW